jgi:epoxyqueuosine reductase
MDDGTVNPQAIILEIAADLGLHLAEITPLGPPKDAVHFEQWLEKGRAADMDWLQKNRQRIVDPRGLAPGPAALLVVGLAHVRPRVDLQGGGRIARYAAGRDYHNRLGKLLVRLGKRLAREGVLDEGRAGRAMTDAAPLLERSHAEEAGIGFASKAANLLHPTFGPWFFLGELVLEADPQTLLSDGPTLAPAGSCGTCTACIDVCPTDAIVAPGQVDAGLCISYQTIENRGPIPHELRPKLSGFAFGCDICSEICPWGIKAETKQDFSEDWGTHRVVEQLSLIDWLEQDEASFKQIWQGSPLQRARRDGLARNAALILGSAPREGSREALLRALESHSSPMVREAAAWALGKAHGAETRVTDALDRAYAQEEAAEWRDLIGLDRDLAGSES